MAADPPSPEAAEPIGSLRVAHELRAQLDAVARALRQQQQEGNDPQTVDPLLAIARDGVEGALDLIERMQDEGAERLMSWCQQSTIGEACTAVVHRLQPVADMERVELEMRIDPGVAELPAGPLMTVMRNGLQNAIEACARHGGLERRVVLAATQTPSGELMILIDDTGGGLAPPEAITSAASTRRPASPPSPAAMIRGIGLDLCRDIIQHLGGTLELIPNPAGCGTRLRIVLEPHSLPVPGANVA